MPSLSVSFTKWLNRTTYSFYYLNRFLCFLAHICISVIQFSGYPIFSFRSDIDAPFPKFTTLIKFMQRPFVLSRLFKKQDESIEVPNHDFAEPAVLSRTTAKSSPEDTQAELAPEPVTKLLRWKTENDPTSVECFIAEAFDGSTSDTVAPVNYNNSNSYGVENKVGELPAPEVRKKLKLNCS
jgi:hypothetical protein